MKLTFQQAARGVNKEVQLNVTDTCPKCQGAKAEPGTRATKCPQCNGTGMVSITETTEPQLYTMILLNWISTYFS